MILSSGILQSLELITPSDGEMVRLLFCQKLLLKDYFVKEIIEKIAAPQIKQMALKLRIRMSKKEIQKH